MTQIINAIYPIGRTIICDHNPQTDYPWQTWTQDFKDRFPLGAGDTYVVGATGGEASHTLTINEIPSHNHSITTSGNDNGIWTAIGIGASGSSINVINDWGNGVKIGNTGGGQPHNNMPPYKAVMMWTRTA